MVRAGDGATRPVPCSVLQETPSDPCSTSATVILGCRYVTPPVRIRPTPSNPLETKANSGYATSSARFTGERSPQPRFPPSCKDPLTSWYGKSNQYPPVPRSTSLGFSSVDDSCPKVLGGWRWFPNTAWRYQLAPEAICPRAALTNRTLGTVLLLSSHERLRAHGSGLLAHSDRRPVQPRATDAEQDPKR